jgi:hypothetical protein
MTKQIDRINRVAKMVGKVSAYTKNISQLLEEDDINIPLNNLIYLIAEKLEITWGEAMSILTKHLISWE